MQTKHIRFVESGETREVGPGTRCVAIPRDMDSEGGKAEVIGEQNGVPVFRYARADGVEATKSLRPMKISDRNPGDELLVETDEVDARGYRRWSEAVIRP